MLFTLPRCFLKQPQLDVSRNRMCSIRRIFLPKTLYQIRGWVSRQICPDKICVYPVYHIITKTADVEKPLLAEDCRLLAFAGSPSNAEWLNQSGAEALLQADPDRNITPEQASDFVRKVVDSFDELKPYLEQKARDYGKELLDAHQRVRSEAQIRGVTYRVEPKLPADVLGIHVYLPAD